MKDILNNLFKSLWYAANLGVNANYKPEHFLKYLYISNLGLFTFIFIIMGIEYDLVGIDGPNGDYRGNNQFYGSSIGGYAYYLPWYSIPFYLTYSFILGLSYLCCTGKSNFWKMLLGTFFHFNLLLCILFTTWTYDFMYYRYVTDYVRDIHASGFLDPIYALPLLLYTLLIIIYFIFYILSPYINKTYSNSLLGLYLETKKIKLEKLKRELKAKIKEDE